MAWVASWNDWEWGIGVNLWSVIHGIKVFAADACAEDGVPYHQHALSGRDRPEELCDEPVARTPEMLARIAAFKAASEASMSPRQLADIVFDAIRKEQF